MEEQEGFDNFLEAMEKAEQKHKAEMEEKGVKPEDNYFICTGCGS